VIDNLSTGSIDNISHLTDNPNFTFVQDTIMNEKVLEELIRNCDIVYHLAAAVGVKYIVENTLDSMLTNVLGTEIILRSAHKEKKKVLLVSSSEVYGKNGTPPQKETDDRLLGPSSVPIWSYASSKIVNEYMGQSYCREKNLPVIMVRLFNTIGPRQTGAYGMVVPRFVKQALSNEPITVYGDGNQTRSFIYVKDVVTALILLGNNENAVGEIFNVGNTRETRIMDLALLVKNIATSKSEIICKPYEELYDSRFEDVARRVPDITKIREFTGWQPVTPLEKAVSEAINSLKKNS